MKSAALTKDGTLNNDKCSTNERRMLNITKSTNLVQLYSEHLKTLKLIGQDLYLSQNSFLLQNCETLKDLADI